MSPFEEELVTHLPNLRAFAWKLTRCSDKAEDLVQMTSERALKARERFVPGTNMRSWLFAVMQNEHHASERKQRRERIRIAKLNPPLLTGPEDAHAVLEFKQTFEQMAQLSDNEREAIIAVGLFGYTHAEVIERDGMTAVALACRLKRGRKKLRAKGH